MKTLEIKNLKIDVSQKSILEGVNLNINKGEVHALVGPNGHGKSSLLLSIMNHFAYKTKADTMKLKGVDISDLEPDEISRLGVFLAFQNPMPIPGLKTIDFLRSVVNSHRDKPISASEYFVESQKNIKKLALDKNIMQREVNINFSGGEKKKNEILQMLMLKNSLVLLDEIDSGLDVDNINQIIDIVNKHHKSTETSYLIVSHYDKMFNTMNVDYTHLVYNKNLVTTKGGELIKQIHRIGYKETIKSLGLEVEEGSVIEEDEPSTLGTCGAKKA